MIKKPFFSFGKPRLKYPVIQSHEKEIDKDIKLPEKATLLLKRPYSAIDEDILKDKKVDAVVIATSATTHFELTKKALLSGKHVFVEKPLALKVKDAEELVKIAETEKRKLMVGHLLEYHPAVEKLKL